MQNRFKNALYNSFSVFFSFLIKTVLQFIIRTFFISYIGVYYLGLDSVFMSVIGILSIAELGIGSSILFALYKVVAQKNSEKTVAYMQLYRKIYKIIAVAILMIGIAVLPFLPHLISINLNQEIMLSYFLILVNSCTGYLLFSYKRSLLIANQKTYIISIIELCIYIFTAIVQISGMIIFKSYLFYLATTLSATIITNIIIAYVTDKKYNLQNITADPLTKEEKDVLKKNVVGNFIGNLASVVVFSTDNLLVASLVNVTTVGLFSNYTLITSTFKRLMEQILLSQTASVGNLIHTENNKKIYTIFKKYTFLNFVISTTISALIFILINPFINIWLGEKFLLSKLFSLVLSTYLFVQAYRNVGFVFYSAYGLFWQSRYKPIIEAIANLVISYILAGPLQLGIIGIILGTIFSNILCNTWFEPYIIFKHGIKHSIREYYYTNIIHWMFFAGIMCFLYYINLFTPTNLIAWCIYAIICFVMILTIVIVAFFNTTECRWLRLLIQSKIKNRD